jgi:hypothetical protein
MQRILLAENLEGRLDCYGRFQCKDQICAAHCALNISCAIVKAKYAAVQPYEDENTIFFKSPEPDY